jgi:hypothetical protein
MKPFVIEIFNESDEIIDNFNLCGFKSIESSSVKVSYPKPVNTNVIIDKFVLEDISESRGEILPHINLIDSKLHIPKALSPTLMFPNKKYLISEYNYRFDLDSSSLEFSFLTPRMKLRIHFYPVGWDKKSFFEKIKNFFSCTFQNNI